MRFKVLILFLLAGWPMLAQSKAELLLDRINSIKLDVEHYDYEVCTEADSTVSVQEASAFLQAKLLALYPAQAFPEDSIQVICGPIRPNRYRAIAYVEKAGVESWYREREQTLRNEKRLEAIGKFLDNLQHAKNVNEIEKLLSESDIKEGIRYSFHLDDNTQVKMADCYLVYYEKSGHILEIMSPVTAFGVRKSIINGETADPLDYTTTPFWFCFEGFK